MNRFSVLLYFFSSSLALMAQPPATNVFSFKFELVSDSIHLSEGKLLTSFNSSGYNNQAAFLDQNKAMITSNWKDPSQTDIYQLDLKKNELLRVTATDESEYSPTPMMDKKHFSVVRVETNEEASQVLWKYPLDRSHAGQILIRNLRDVGYHTWIDESKLAIFHVGDPNWLDIRELKTGIVKLVSNNTGRTFRVHGDRLYYVYKLSDQFWQLKYFDFNLEKSVMVLKCLENQEDFAITDDGHFLMGKDSSLYLFRMGQDKNWKKVADLEQLGINKISRIQVNKDRILMVSAD